MTSVMMVNVMTLKSVIDTNETKYVIRNTFQIRHRLKIRYRLKKLTDNMSLKWQKQHR